MSIHVVVMGVAGCGKSTVAEAIHERLGYAYAEGDDFHPQANIDKMSAGIPLTDEDRWPWLNVINSWMVAREALGEKLVGISRCGHPAKLLGEKADGGVHGSPLCRPAAKGRSQVSRSRDQVSATAPRAARSIDCDRC